MSAHTPGPWCYKFEKGIGHVVVDTKHDLIVARVEDGVDDALLIAAAPRMLQLVRRIAETREGEPQGDEARAILRDVEGESND